MRYAEIENNKVRYVLPAEIEADYKVLPPNCLEIGIAQDVQAGDILEVELDAKSGEILKSFRRQTDDEINAPYKLDFEAERATLFFDTQWVRERHADRIEQGIDDKENWNEWLKYWQALRDLPASEGFDYKNIIYPVNPK